MRRQNILLVEDNQDDIDLAKRALARHNINNDLVVARSGEDALEYLFATGRYSDRDKYDLPAVTLLDLKLPKIDGLEVLKEIRSNSLTRVLPVVILTSSIEDRDLVEGYERGANSYVRKPVDFNEFVEAVRVLGIYWTLHNELPPISSLS